MLTLLTVHTLSSLVLLDLFKNLEIFKIGKSHQKSTEIGRSDQN